MTVQWSPQQAAALDAVAAWHRAYSAGERVPQVFRVFGFAGTGKTTLARHFASTIKGRTVYAAYTGKAALMMQRNGCEGASTIHGLIYQVKERPDGSVEFVLDPESAAADAALIVIDECSMVDEEIGRDLLSYRRPILVLGDPAQLPPVKGAGFFTAATPDVMLTEIHRQAKDNPIIRLATASRLGERLALGEYGASQVVARGVLSGAEVLRADQVLVGRNDTRRQYNARMRGLRGFGGPLPEAGDRLVCLKNDRSKGIFNGGLFRMTQVLEPVATRGRDAGFMKLLLGSDDFPDRAGIEVKVHRAFFDGDPNALDWTVLRGSQHFDFGYALTCHKAQGSQWPDVIAYDESGTFREDWARWLYTAITRASERITVVQ